MELIRGQPLLEFAASRSLDARSRLRLFTKICDAVHYAHQNGILHRDLKPENMLVTNEGAPKLIDFGVAKTITRDGGSLFRTTPGQIIGTFQYMSPEQCAGTMHSIDTRSDIYSLGVVLYEFLCGTLPYDLSQAPLTEISSAIRNVTPLPPSKHDRRLARDIDAITLKALDKDPRQRYQSASELARDIDRYLRGDPVEARMGGFVLAGTRWLRRHPLVATAILCASVGMIVLGSFLIVGWFLLRVPGRLELDPRGLRVTLFSLSGGVLHTWRSPVEWGIRRAINLPSDDYAIVALEWSSSVHNEYAGRICFYDSDDWETPFAISDNLTWEDVPSGPSRHRDGVFYADVLCGADILTELPGDEVLVVRRLAPYSQSVIQVFDNAGRVRFQVWHDGGVDPDSAYFFRDKDRLVLSGLDAWPWTRRGIDFSKYPIVLLALDIVDGHIENNHFMIEDGLAKDPCLAWYRWLGPTDVVESLGDARSSLQPPPMDLPGDRCFGLEISRVDDRRTGATYPYFQLVIDDTGSIIRRRCDAFYGGLVAEKKRVDVKVYELVDLLEMPPIVD